MTSLAMIVFFFPLILRSILVWDGRCGGQLELRFYSVERILRFYTKLLACAHKLFQEFKGRMSLYIDDRLNGERFASKGFWSCPLLQRTPEYSYQSAEATLYIVCSVLANVGYFLGLSKCVLSSVTRIRYLA